MDSRQFDYIRFPLHFIRDMLRDKDAGIRKMLLYGYCLVAERMDIDQYNAYRQVVYCFYRYVQINACNPDYSQRPKDNRAILPNYILREITNMVDCAQIDINEDYFGWDGNGQIDIDCEVQQLIEHGKKVPDFERMVMEFHRLRNAAELFSITITNIDAAIAEYRKYRSDNAKHTRWVSIKIGLLFEYLSQSKSEYQVMLLAAYMGVKAIIGNKPYARTTKSYILANMFGCMNEAELQTLLCSTGNETLAVLHKKYSTRKMFDKLNRELQEKGFVPEWLPHGKAGTFVSTKLRHKVFLREVKKEFDGRKSNANKIGVTAKEYRKYSMMELNEIRNNAT